MKRSLCFTMMLVIFLTACAASPTPTPPTAEPEPTSVPTPEPSGPSGKFGVVGDGPVVPHGKSGAWDSGVTWPGSVVEIGGTLYLFRKGYPSFNNPGVGSVGYSTSSDGLTWEPGGDPVIGDFDGKFASPGVMPGSVLAAADGSLVMYFWVTDDEATHLASIWRATGPSADGPWALSPDHAVLSYGEKGTWDDGGVISPSVVEKDGQYTMLYTGNDLKGEFNQIGVATSPDGINWTKHPDPVISGDGDGWDGGSAQEGRLVDTPEGLVMLYGGWPPGGMDSGFGLARSSDGITWERCTANPVIRGGDFPAGGFLHIPALYYDGGRYSVFIEIVGGDSSETWLAMAVGDPCAGQ